ncbi:MAG: aminoglycoside phosphotransferase family protein [Parcubacteria group bacterium]|jgi:thiamine kinase-like enzyme
MFQAELKKLIKKEFPDEILEKLSVFPLALTTVAYKINFKSGRKLVAKIGFDEWDLKRGKGLKEKTAIRTANDILGPDKSPKLVKCLNSCPGFPGYVTFLEFIEGEILEPEEFNAVAGSEFNLNELSGFLINLHSLKQKNFSDMFPNGKRDLYEYFSAYHKRIKSTLESDNIFEKLEERFNDLPEIYEYFKNYSPHCFLHGDVNFKNVLVSENKIKALIDWDRSLIAPIAFEFAHVSTLTDQYGVTEWHNNLIKSYLEKYSGDSEKLHREFKMIELFIYFKMLTRKLTHKLQKGTIQLCAGTGEELKDHFIRKILEHRI